MLGWRRELTFLLPYEDRCLSVLMNETFLSLPLLDCHVSFCSCSSNSFFSLSWKLCQLSEVRRMRSSIVSLAVATEIKTLLCWGKNQVQQKDIFLQIFFCALENKKFVVYYRKWLSRMRARISFFLSDDTLKFMAGPHQQFSGANLTKEARIHSDWSGLWTVTPGLKNIGSFTDKSRLSTR